MVRSNKHKHTPTDAAIDDAGRVRPLDSLKCLARGLARAAARQHWREAATGKQPADRQPRKQASTSKQEKER